MHPCGYCIHGDITMLIRYLKRPPRFDYLHKWLRKPSVRILDVACGNHSPSLTKQHYPECKYYGLDKTRSYNLDSKDFNCMEQFYEIDLSNTDDLDRIPDDFFDCLILSHIIEHLENGESVIVHLLGKLKKGGVIYIEFPSPRSVHFPSMKGTLNFYDDPAHIKLHSLRELELLLTDNGCLIIRSGIRRSLKRILLLPVYIVGSLAVKGYVSGGVFWDILGFANYVIASRNG